MPVTRDTPWRTPLDVPYEFWRDTITSARNPNGTGERADPELASIAAWNMAQPHTALALSKMVAESSLGTDFDDNPRSNKNTFNLKSPTYDGTYVKYRTWIEGVKGWHDRITSLTYNELSNPGVYADTETIAELIHVFAPTSENATEQYIAGVVQRMNAYPVVVETPSTPEEPIPEEGEPMPLDPEILKPDFIDAYVTKRSDRQGFNFGTRGPIDLLFVHERQGRIGTAKAGQRFFACLTDTSCNAYGICSDGERCQDALVDWEILRDGTLVQYQDPYDTNRIPWASGGAENNSNAIGRAINAKYRGVFGGVNKVGAAVEIEKTDGEPCTPAQIQTAGRLMAYVMAKRGYPANDWEYPDVLGGNIYTVPNHGDVSQTSCRIDDSDKNAMKAVCSKALAAFYQGTSPGEEPQPEPPKPIEEIIPGLDYSVAARLFGTAKGEDGVTYKFDKNGPVSKLWLAEGKATGEWPALTAVYSYSDGRRYFVFDGGDTVIAVKGQEPRWLKDAA